MKEDIRNLILSQDNVANAIQERYDIEDYLDKISRNATIITHYEQSALNGFIAFYANDPNQEQGFLTILIIDSGSKGKGLGKLLLGFSINALKSKSFQNYKLEVSKDNPSAISLYKSVGFSIENETDSSFLMNLNLNDNG